MTETATPNPADFSRNEREREYEARIVVRGTLTIAIQADSEADAQRQAEEELAKIENDGFVEVESIDSIEIDRVYKEQPMYRALRGGQKYQVTHLEPGDLPREPDELGF